MNKWGFLLMQIITTIFLLTIALIGVIRAINCKSDKYEGFLTIGSILCLIWVVNV